MAGNVKIWSTSGGTAHCGKSATKNLGIFPKEVTSDLSWVHDMMEECDVGLGFSLSGQLWVQKKKIKKKRRKNCSREPALPWFRRTHGSNGVCTWCTQRIFARRGVF